MVNQTATRYRAGLMGPGHVAALEKLTAAAASISLGTVTTGTITPDAASPFQHYVNGGAHTLAPGAKIGAYSLDITNNATAGAITVTGWTKVIGAFVTTDAHKFRCRCSIGASGSLLEIVPLQ